MSASGLVVGGYLDFWGPSGDPGKSILCGWLGHPWRSDVMTGALAIEVDTSEALIRSQAIGMSFARTDIAAVGIGVVLLVDAPAETMSGILSVDLVLGGRTCRMNVANSVRALDAAGMRDAARPVVLRSAPVDHRQITLACLDAGETEYVSNSGASVSVTAVLDCSPVGALVLGVLRAETRDVTSVILVCGGKKHNIASERTTVGPLRGAESRLACLVGQVGLEVGERWLEVGLAGGLVARTLLPQAHRADRAALLLALGAFGSACDLDRVFDEIAGPAIGALQSALRATPVQIGCASFGAQISKPVASMVIPLHRRIDYLEVQLALASGQLCMQEVEIIYVVDDPPRQEEALQAAKNASARLGIGCRLLLPSRVMGFAGASNAGLKEARGGFVCFMNSDVFGGGTDWLRKLIARLEADGTLGLVGPRLVFPDGSVQHEGMVLEMGPGGWRYPRHLRKGHRPEGDGLARADCITGACIVMRRAVAKQLGGFDETFVIGDFEDADLCARARALGYLCAVDRDETLLHLERKSQETLEAWRAGATMYNAWLHERRWFKSVAKPVSRRRRG